MGVSLWSEGGVLAPPGAEALTAEWNPLCTGAPLVRTHTRTHTRMHAHTHSTGGFSQFPLEAAVGFDKLPCDQISFSLRTHTHTHTHTEPYTYAQTHPHREVSWNDAICQIVSLSPRSRCPMARFLLWKLHNYMTLPFPCLPAQFIY